MVVEKLYLKNFRNYEYEEINFSEGVNLIYGDNGQGKTNIAEAVYLFSAAKSHRTNKERDLIKIGENFSELRLEFLTNTRKMTADFKIFSDKCHQLKINGVPNIKNSEFIGTFQAVMFSPEDFSFIKDGPSERRRFMDIAISQLKPSYFKLLSEYNRYIKSKMKALKFEEYFPMIDVYNQKIAEISADILLYRKDFIEKLKPKIKKINSLVTKSDDELYVEYESFVEISENKETLKKEILKKLNRGKQREIFEKSCLYGPHREDLSFYLEKKRLRDFGSQGQVRTAVLSVKLAQAEIIEESFGEYPVLILDDILSELDSTRRKFLLDEIRGKQVIITGTDKANFGKRKDTKLILVENGKCKF